MKIIEIGLDESFESKRDAIQNNRDMEAILKDGTIGWKHGKISRRDFNDESYALIIGNTKNIVYLQYKDLKQLLLVKGNSPYYW